MFKSCLVLILSLLVFIPLLADDVSAIYDPFGPSRPWTVDVSPQSPNTPELSHPNNFPSERTSAVFSITPLGADEGAKMNAGGRYADSGYSTGDIYIMEPTKILPNPIFANNIDQGCILGGVSLIDLPTNIDNGVAIGFHFSTSLECIDLSTSDQRLLLDKEIRVQLYGRGNDTAFFFSPRENITTAQPILRCDDDKLTANQTLKGNIEMCYGNYNGDMIIISKRLVYFGATSLNSNTMSALFGDPNAFFLLYNYGYGYNNHLFSNDQFYNVILNLLTKTPQKEDPQVYNTMSPVAKDIIRGITPVQPDLDNNTTYFRMYVTPALSDNYFAKFDKDIPPTVIDGYLETIGAKDIITMPTSQKTIFIHALVPIHKVLELSAHLNVVGLSRNMYMSPTLNVLVPPIHTFTHTLLEDSGQIINHNQYINTVNSTLPITSNNIDFFNSNDDITKLFSMMPKCDDIIHTFDHTVSMSTGGIVINYTLEKIHDTTSSRVLVLLTSDSESSSISLDLTRTGQNTTHVFYQSIIPNSLFDVSKDISMELRIFSTDNTIHNDHIFTNTTDALYYQKNADLDGTPLILSLPAPTGNVQLVNGTHDIVNGTVKVPSGSSVSLAGDTVCKYGKVKPNKDIIQIFDMSPDTITNTTEGLEFKYTFTKQDRPKQLNWVVTDTDTGNSFWGNTTDRITKQYTLNMPLETSGSYNIIVYGTEKQDRKLSGIYDTSYTFVTPDVIDDQDNESMPVTPNVPNTPDESIPTAQITLPASYRYDTTGKTIDLYAGIDNKMRIDTRDVNMGTAYHINDKAEITISHSTQITSESFTAQGNQYCYVGDLMVDQNSNVSVQHTNTLFIQFRQATDPARCDGSPDITFSNKLDLDKEIYVRFVSTDGQTPFYYTDDMTNIPKCSSTNFDHTTNTLIGDTEICYGKDNKDTIIISKILAVFGVSDIDDTTDNTNTETPTVPNVPDVPISPVIVPTISITVPDSMLFDNIGRTIDLYTDNNRIRIDTYYADMGTAYHINNKADITIFRGTEITGKSFVSQSDSYCYVGDLQVGHNADIARDHTDTLHLEFRQADDPDRCDQAPDISLNGKLDLNKEIYVRFVGTDGQVPFYHYRDDTGSTLVDIPKCTDTNFDSSTNKLDNTKVCYGKDGANIIIVSKILAVFGI